MTTQTIDTTSVKQAIDLIDYAGRYTTLHRESAREQAGPCPKCGGNDRFHCTAEWFFCRQCHPKPGDPIEFVQWLNGCTFKEAVAILTNAPLPTTPATKHTPALKRQTEQPVDWQRKAAAMVEMAHRRLFDDHDQAAEAGRRYLEGRGLESHAWLAFKLGYTPSAALPGTEGTQRHPAIVLPWYRAGTVGAVRYRFLQAHEYTDQAGRPRKEKQTALSGSGFAGVLFGGQAYDPGIVGLSTLLICEGELNAASIWQVAKDTHLDVLSLGSESATLSPAMIEHAGKYATVITWLDQEDYVRHAMRVLPGAYGIKSPDGKDANDLLQTGALSAFVAMHRFQAARNHHEQLRLLYDLQDATRLFLGGDDGTRRAIERIGSRLGGREYKSLLHSDSRPPQ